MRKKTGLAGGLLILVMIGLAGCDRTRLAERPDGSVGDQTVIAQIGYDNYWQHLTSDDGSAFTETELEADDYNWDNYLRLCGGLWPRGFVLMKHTAEGDLTVSAQTEFLSHLGQIESPEEAMAYIYATNCYLSPAFGEVKQFVNRTEDGFEVGVIQYNFIGCGNHAHTQKLFAVKPTGAWELVKEVKLERGEEFCGD